MPCQSCGGELVDGICPSCEATLVPSSVAASSRAGQPWDDGSKEPTRDSTWIAGRRPTETTTDADDASPPPTLPTSRTSDLSTRRFAPGTLLTDRYRIVNQAGRGGMGEVYRADDLKLNEPVALKLLPESVDQDAKRLAAFLEEARLARKISHPNICRVHDIVEADDGLHFISMEFVDGENLASLLRRIGRLPRSKALEIARECVQAMVAAHDAGILHRDLKPANVMLDGAGRVRITDFGLAGAMGTRASGGTPAYMAPELHDGQRGSVASDLYALGLIFYELFTGQRPFGSSSRRRLAQMHRSVEPPAPSEVVPGILPELDRLILGCLKKNPARRPALRDLDRVFKALQVVESATPMADEPFRRPESFAVPVWGVSSLGRRLVIVLLAFAGVVYLATLQSSREPPLDTAAVAETEVGAAVRARPGLAVLPIRGLQEDSAARWIGLAAAEILFTELSLAEQLRVVPLHQVDVALTEMALSETETYSDIDLKRIQRRLGVDHVVIGSYSRIAQELGTGLLRLDLRCVEIGAGAVLATHGVTGSEAELVNVVLRAGERLRQDLAPSARSADLSSSSRDALPNDPKAVRAFVEGKAFLRRLELSEARRLLSEAIEIEPDHPMPHAALAEVWWKLGYEARARSEIDQAVALSESLGIHDRQEIMARAARYEHRLDDAIALLEALVRSQPDQLDHRVQLIRSQVDRGLTADAESTLKRARELPPPLGDHPILDYHEARLNEQLGRHAELQRLARRAAEKAERMEASNLVAAAHVREAVAWYNLGDREAEAVAIEQARSLYERLGNRSGAAHCLQRLGIMQLARGDLDGSERLFQRAWDIYSAIGHDLNMGTTSLNLATIEYQRGELDAAITRLESAVELFRRVENDGELATALGNLGSVFQTRGRFRDAFHRYREALDVFTAQENRARIAIVLNNIGEMQSYLGDLGGARATLQEARALARELGDRTSLGYGTYRLGEVYRAQGDLFVASAHYAEALKIFDAIEDERTAAEVRIGLAWVALAEGDSEIAARRAEEAEQYFRSVEMTGHRHLAEVVRGRALLELRGHLPARQVVDQLRREAGGDGQPLVGYDLDLLEAQVLVAEGRALDALTLLSEVTVAAREVGLVGYELEARVASAELEAASTTEDPSEDIGSLLDEVETRGYGALAKRLRVLGSSTS